MRLCPLQYTVQASVHRVKFPCQISLDQQEPTSYATPVRDPQPPQPLFSTPQSLLGHRAPSKCLPTRLFGRLSTSNSAPSS